MFSKSSCHTVIGKVRKSVKTKQNSIEIVLSLGTGRLLKKPENLTKLKVSGKSLTKKGTHIRDFIFLEENSERYLHFLIS